MANIRDLIELKSSFLSILNSFKFSKLCIGYFTTMESIVTATTTTQCENKSSNCKNIRNRKRKSGHKKCGRPSIVDYSDLKILKSILHNNFHLPETQIHQEWNLRIGKSLSRSTCRRNLKKLRSAGFLKENKNSKLLGIQLGNLTKSSPVISEKQGKLQRQQSLLRKKQETNDRGFIFSVPSNFCEVQLNETPIEPQKQQPNVQNSHTSEFKFTYSSSQKQLTNGLTKKSPLFGSNRKKLSSSSSLSHQNLSSHHSQNENLKNSSKNHARSNNLSSFGGFIDAELEKLDENSLAVAKMKINRILFEASSGMYKNIENKTDTEDENSCDAVIIADSLNDENENCEEPINSDDSSERQRVLNRESHKENRTPSSPVAQINSRSSDNNLDSSHASVFRKKRIKPKDVLSALYQILKTKLNNTEPKTTFGSYVSNEMQAMDSETIKIAKLSICRILFEASVGKLRNTDDSNLFDIPIEYQPANSSDSNRELITPKSEMIDDYEL